MQKLHLFSKKEKRLKQITTKNVDNNVSLLKAMLANPGLVYML